MSYVLSSELKEKIKNIPWFKSEISDIRNLSYVKEKYGISEDENVISYRVVPKIFSELLNGGTIFTDKGVYKSLPTGYFSSDYVTYGIKYEEMIDYIPFLGYSETFQPQLVGGFREKENLSFWMTPVAGIDSNFVIVSIFKDIIRELTQQDPELRKKQEITIETFILQQKQNFDTKGSISNKDETILEDMVKEKIVDSNKNEVFFLIFANKISKNNYEEAYSFVENHSNLMEEFFFLEKIDLLVKKQIEKVGVPDSKETIDKLTFLCEKNNSYIPIIFSNILTYYSKKEDFLCAEEFILKFENTEYTNEMRILLDSKIEELIKEHCELGKFQQAYNLLNKITQFNKNEDYIEKLELIIKDFMIKYASEKYVLSKDHIKLNDFDSAIRCLVEAVGYDSQNQTYWLDLIFLLIETKAYVKAKNIIREAVKTKIFFDDENYKKLRDFKIACSKGMNEEMSVYYTLLKDNNYTFLNEKSSDLSKRDQIGLNYYHYSIFLKKVDFLDKVSSDLTTLNQDLCGYDIRSFACVDKSYFATFITLLKRYDEEAKELYQTYSKNINGNKLKKFGLGILESAIGSAIQSAKNTNAKLSHMQRDLRYFDQRDYIEEKRSTLEDTMQQMKCYKENLHQRSLDYSKQLTWDDYEEDMSLLGEAKFVSFRYLLDEKLNREDFRSKLIYNIVKNPECLQDIFFGNSTEFELYEEGDDFWFLPKSIILKINNE